MKKMFFGIAVGILVTFAFVLQSSAQTRIRFAPGRTSATMSGVLAGRATRSYVLGARRGQDLSGNVSSANDCIKFTDGSTSVGFTTTRGDNVLSVTNYCGRRVSYVMTVSINY
jgi:hypothetical protein